MNFIFPKNRTLSPFVIIPYILSALLALFLPHNGWQHYPEIEDFFNFIGTNVPFIKGNIEKSKFPEVARIYFVASAFIFLPTLFGMWKNKDLLFKQSVTFESQYTAVTQKRFPTLFCLFACLFLFLTICILILQPGYQFNVMPIHDKRWALALFGPIYSWVSIYALISGLRSYFIYFVRLLK